MTPSRPRPFSRPAWVTDLVKRTHRSHGTAPVFSQRLYWERPTRKHAERLYRKLHDMHPILTSDGGFDSLYGAGPRSTGTTTVLGIQGVPTYRAQGAALGFMDEATLLWASKPKTGVDTSQRVRFSTIRGPWKEGDWPGEAPMGQVLETLDVTMNWWDSEARFMGGWQGDPRSSQVYRKLSLGEQSALFDKFHAVAVDRPPGIEPVFRRSSEEKLAQMRREGMDPHPSHGSWVYPESPQHPQHEAWKL